MPHHVPLRAGDPRRVGRYRLTGRLAGLPSDDPLFIGTGPDGIAVAICLLGGDWAKGTAARDRFAAEAAVARRVPPFCAARVLDAGLDGDSAYLVSEYIPGQSLLELVTETGVRHSPEVEALAIGMATGMASVHQAGLVHGSFGPQYVILPAEGPPRVVEFGITPPYGSATPSADMLAWAQTVVFAATGHPPSGRGDLDLLPGRTREPVQQCLEPGSPERPAARAVLQFLLGDGYPAAGLLAEGSRRAVRSALPPRPPTGGAPAVPAERGEPAGAADRARQPRPNRLVTPQSQRRRPGQRGRHLADRATGAGSRHSGVPGVPGQRDGAQGRAARSRAQSARRHPAAWAIGGAVVVVAVLVALLIAYLPRGGPPASHGKLPAKTGHPAATASPTPSPSLGPTMPTAFNGTWSGLVTQPPVTYTVTVTLTSGQSSGTVVYTGADFNCSGDLSLTSATATTMTMSQGIVVGQSTCGNGTVTVSLSGASSIDFNFQSNPAATGTLTRQ
ncbi:MAG: hypothetical protein ACRDOK_23070 [Streptosporangiaceae bacterium]